MAEKGTIISISQARRRRERRQDSTTDTPKPRGGVFAYRAAVRDYRRALETGDESLQSDAAGRIYALRGNRGADVIAGLQTQDRARRRSEAKSRLRIVGQDEQ